MQRQEVVTINQDKMEACKQMIQILELPKKNIRITNINMLLVIKEKIEKFDEKNTFYHEVKSIKSEEGI